MGAKNFTKDVTNAIKGIAITLMFAHHFFTFPHYWVEGIKYEFWKIWGPILCKPFQICVPIFCFITGYFYFFNKRKDLSYSIKKCLKLLIPYWIVASAYISISILCGNQYTAFDILLEFFALKRSTMIFCWYVYFYLAVMFILPVFARICKKKRINKYIVIFCMLSGVLVIINNKLPVFDTIIVWLPIIISGYFAAEYAIFDYIDKKKIPAWMCAFAFIIVSLLRWCFPDIQLSYGSVKIFTFNMDVIYALVAVYSLIVFINWVKQFNIKLSILEHMGSKSLYMWFVHCIFFNNCKQVFQKFLYWPHNTILVLIWGLAVCYVLAGVVQRITNTIETKVLRW